MQPPARTRSDYIHDMLTRPAPEAAQSLAKAVEAKHPGAAIILYGSGISVLKNASSTDVLYDFYVIVPSYRKAFGAYAKNPKAYFLALLNRALPPNVFYIEHPTPAGLLRAKYSVVSLSHFENLVGVRTFHSYFWARFAQPCCIVMAPPDMERRLGTAIETAIDTFVTRAAPLTQNQDPLAIWTAGLGRSYRAELRAESPDRVQHLLESYGQWPEKVTRLPAHPASQKSAVFGWKIRSVQGGILSVLRLLKGTLTFEGGVDYIAWKISRHAGFTLPVHDWERKWPVFGIPLLARRYYKMRKEAQK